MAVRTPCRPPDLPEGICCTPGFLSESEELALLGSLHALDWDRRSSFHRRGRVRRHSEIDFLHNHGRRGRTTSSGPGLPEFIEATRHQCAEAAGIETQQIQHVIASRYRPGAGIDWRIDSTDGVDGVSCWLSLAASCVMQLREWAGTQTWELPFERRSLIILQGPARFAYEHRVPPVRDTRFSVTVKTIRC